MAPARPTHQERVIGRERPSAWVHLALSTPRIAQDDREMAEDSEMDMEHLVAADVMTVNPVVVSLDATLEEADLILRSTYVTGIPVVDGDGVLVGVIGHANLAWHQFGRRISSSERGSPKSGSTG